MILIDIDKLYDNLRKMQNEPSVGFGHLVSLENLLEVIGAKPAIDAIPVEWLMERHKRETRLDIFYADEAPYTFTTKTKLGEAIEIVYQAWKAEKKENKIGDK